MNEKGRGIISFDLQIINLDEENETIYSETIQHLEEILNKNNAKLEILEKKEERIDEKPFKHKHIFHKIIFKKSSE